MTQALQYILNNWDQVLGRTQEHLTLVFWAVGLAIFAGVPLGILITRDPRLASPVLGFANVMQTVPALAFFGFLMPVAGIGRTTAIVVLFLYSLLPIIRNTYTGIKNVDPALVEAARGMGLTDLQTLFMVQLPLALPVIVVGVRVATVVSIGTATVAFLVGGGALGAIITRGLARGKDYIVFAGAAFAALLAIVADLALTWVERLLTPAGIRTPGGRRPRGRRQPMLASRSSARNTAAGVPTEEADGVHASGDA